MSGLRARVKNGRLILDVPTDLPEDTVIDLVVDDDDDDDLAPDEIAARDESLRIGLAEARAGNHRPVEELLDVLRRRRRE